MEVIVTECPCGKGSYTEYIDRTPGFREHDAYFQCNECDKKYKLIKMSNGRFKAELK